MKREFSAEQFWADAWTRHIESYLRAPARVGYWIRTRFGLGLSVLELAGGSCRDSRYLAEHGVHAIGSDFDQKTLNYLGKRFPGSPLALRREDAFAINMPDHAVDLVFSNGFWVLFDDDEQLRQLAREQARVARKWMIVIAHNSRNAAETQHFADLARSDPLYDIRFFTAEEIIEIVRSAGIPYKNIKVEKFGGMPDVMFRKTLKKFPNPLLSIAPMLVPHLYRFQGWERAERIACIVEFET